MAVEQPLPATDSSPSSGKRPILASVHHQLLVFWSVLSTPRLRRALITVSVLFGLAIIIVQTTSGLWLPPTHFEDFYDRLRHHTGPQHDATSTTQSLHVLVPATERSPQVCRLVLSTALSGYTTPTLVSYNKTRENSDWIDGGNRIGKITGVLEYLDRIRPEENHDLLMIVDGYDTWLQLPPSILIRRYKEINQELYERAARKIGDSGMDEGNVMQSIVFGAQKTCGPLPSWTDYACSAQPESPLAKDLYGADTDTLDSERHLPAKYRPRWLSSSFVMGPALDVRALFERAREKITTSASPHKGSDQQIFSGIFGEQEYYREELRLKHRSWLQRQRDNVAMLLGLYKPGVVDQHPNPRPVPSKQDTRRLDFGIGLDYKMQLVHSALYAEQDGGFLLFADGKQTWNTQKEAGVAQPHLVRLPDDIEGSKPFELLLQSKEGIAEVADQTLAEQGWSEVPLFGNFYAPSVPSALHWSGLNETRDGSWANMWFHRHARRLLQAYVNTQGQRTTTGGHRPLGAYTETGKWIPWSQLCEGFDEELFGDGQGAFDYGTVEGFERQHADGADAAGAS